MKEIKVGNKGFVRLVSHMNDDAFIAQAARVSYQKGTKKLSDDVALIDTLMRERHTSPFEMVEFVFHIKLPIFVARQLIRHRTASVNEISGRYSVLESEFFVPEELRHQHQLNKQASSHEKFESSYLEAHLIDLISETSANLNYVYETLLNKKVSRELARIVLPLSTYTEMYWKIDLHNLLHFLKLRIDKESAQKEIVEYAEAILSLIEDVVPHTIKSWKNHVLNSVTISADEIKILQRAAYECVNCFDFDTNLEKIIKEEIPNVSKRRILSIVEKIKTLLKR